MILNLLMCFMWSQPMGIDYECLRALSSWAYITCGRPHTHFPQPEPMLWLDQPLQFLLWLQDTAQQQPSGNLKKNICYS